MQSRSKAIVNGFLKFLKQKPFNGFEVYALSILIIWITSCTIGCLDVCDIVRNLIGFDLQSCQYNLSNDQLIRKLDKQHRVCIDVHF